MGMLQSMGLQRVGRDWATELNWTDGLSCSPTRGIEPVSPALAGGFLTTGPPRKSFTYLFFFLEDWLDFSEPLFRVRPIWASPLGAEWLHVPASVCCYCSVAWSRLTLCHPVDCSQPGSSVCGISQARILEWVAISFSSTYYFYWSNTMLC